MAKQVKLPKGKEFVFKAAKGGAKDSRYDWDAWLNGDLLLLERSIGKEDDKGTVVEVEHRRDFEVSVNAMIGKLKSAARRRYKVCQFSKLDADGKKMKDALIIRARDMSPEERVGEDKKRKEERAKRAAKEEAGDAPPAANPPTDAGLV